MALSCLPPHTARSLLLSRWYNFYVSRLAEKAVSHMPENESVMPRGEISALEPPNSSPLEEIAAFPPPGMAFPNSFRGKLLLVHGMLNENVHFCHTARLINAMNHARKPYYVLLLPDEHHLPRRRADRVYLNERIVGYFQQHL